MKKLSLYKISILFDTFFGCLETNHCIFNIVLLTQIATLILPVN